MSYESSQRSSLSPKLPLFSGGYADNCSNFDLGPNMSPYLRNVRFDGVDVVIRPGHTLFGTLSSGTTPKGIGSYLRDDPTGDRVVVRHDQGSTFTAAYLTGGTSATAVVATWNAVTSGVFKITIDRVSRTISGLNFAACATMADVAGVIQAGIRAKTGLTETVVWTGGNHFVVTSSIATVNSQVSQTVGITYYTPGYFTGNTTATTNYLTWKSVTDGSFSMFFDGVNQVISGINFSAVTSMTDVASTIQAAIRLKTGGLETVTFSTNKFIIGSGNTTASSGVGSASTTFIGTDISGTGSPKYLDCYAFGSSTGAVLNTDIGGSGATAFMDAEYGRGTVTGNGAKALVTYDVNGSAAAIDTGANIQSTNKMRFINTSDRLFCMNGSDQLGKLYGTTYTTISTGFTKVTFNSSGMSDLKAYGGNTVHTFLVTIDAVGATDTFTRTIDGAGGASSVSITGGYQTLSNGLSIKFTNKTGHTLNDNWTINTTATANPSFGVIFNSSMFVAGVTGSMDTVFKSVGNIYEDFSNLGSDSFTFGEPVTGLAATNQALFYFTKNKVAVTATSDVNNDSGILSYFNRGLSVVEGAFNHDCIVPVGNNIYYLNSAIQINQIATGQNINGFECLNLSDRSMAGCSKLMDSLDRDQTGSYGEYVSSVGLVKRHLKTDGASYPDIVIIYDTEKDKFLVDNNKYFYGGVDFHQKHYSISAVEPKVFIDEYGADDDDTPIPFEYWTKELPITDATLKKVLWEMRTLMDINELAEVTQEIWLDGVLKDTKVIDKDSITGTFKLYGIGVDAVGTDPVGEDGTTTDGSLIDSDYQELIIMRTKGNLNVRFKKMQIRWYSTKTAAKLRLKTVAGKFEQLDPLTNILTP